MFGKNTQERHKTQAQTKEKLGELGHDFVISWKGHVGCSYVGSADDSSFLILPHEEMHKRSSSMIIMTLSYSPKTQSIT